MPRYPSITVILTEEEKSELETIAKGEDRSVSNLAARIIRQWLEARKQDKQP